MKRDLSTCLSGLSVGLFDFIEAGGNFDSHCSAETNESERLWLWLFPHNPPPPEFTALGIFRNFVPSSRTRWKTMKQARLRPNPNISPNGTHQSHWRIVCGRADEKDHTGST